MALQRTLDRVNRQIDRLACSLERMHLEEYLHYVDNTKKLLWINFLAGIARGLGMAVGFTVLGAVVVVLLQRLVVENVPWIGDFLADVVRVVRDRL